MAGPWPSNDYNGGFHGGQHAAAGLYNSYGMPAAMLYDNGVSSPALPGPQQARSTPPPPVAPGRRTSRGHSPVVSTLQHNGFTGARNKAPSHTQGANQDGHLFIDASRSEIRQDYTRLLKLKEDILAGRHPIYKPPKQKSPPPIAPVAVTANKPTAPSPKPKEEPETNSVEATASLEKAGASRQPHLAPSSDHTSSRQPPKALPSVVFEETLMDNGKDATIRPAVAPNSIELPMPAFKDEPLSITADLDRPMSGVMTDSPPSMVPDTASKRDADYLPDTGNKRTRTHTLSDISTSRPRSPEPALTPAVAGPFNAERRKSPVAKAAPEEPADIPAPPTIPPRPPSAADVPPPRLRSMSVDSSSSTDSFDVSILLPPPKAAGEKRRSSYGSFDDVSVCDSVGEKRQCPTFQGQQRQDRRSDSSRGNPDRTSRDDNPTLRGNDHRQGPDRRCCRVSASPRPEAASSTRRDTRDYRDATQGWKYRPTRANDSRAGQSNRGEENGKGRRQQGGRRANERDRDVRQPPPNARGDARKPIRARSPSASLSVSGGHGRTDFDRQDERSYRPSTFYEPPSSAYSQYPSARHDEQPSISVSQSAPDFLPPPSHLGRARYDGYEQRTGGLPSQADVAAASLSDRIGSYGREVPVDRRRSRSPQPVHADMPMRRGPTESERPPDARQVAAAAAAATRTNSGRRSRASSMISNRSLQDSVGYDPARNTHNRLDRSTDSRTDHFDRRAPNNDFSPAAEDRDRRYGPRDERMLPYSSPASSAPSRPLQSRLHPGDTSTSFRNMANHSQVDDYGRNAPRRFAREPTDRRRTPSPTPSNRSYGRVPGQPEYRDVADYRRLPLDSRPPLADYVPGTRHEEARSERSRPDYYDDRESPAYDQAPAYGSAPTYLGRAPPPSHTSQPPPPIYDVRDVRYDPRAAYPPAQAHYEDFRPPRNEGLPSAYSPVRDYPDRYDDRGSGIANARPHDDAYRGRLDQQPHAPPPRAMSPAPYDERYGNRGGYNPDHRSGAPDYAPSPAYRDGPPSHPPYGRAMEYEDARHPPHHHPRHEPEQYVPQGWQPPPGELNERRDHGASARGPLGNRREDDRRR